MVDDHDLPNPPVYSDGQINVYRATTIRDLIRQREAQWTRELSEGTVSPEDRAYRRRMRAIHAEDWPAIPCDRCGAPGAAPLVVVGSPLGIIKIIEDGGLAVPGGRDRLLMTAKDEALLGRRLVSARFLIFCADHRYSDSQPSVPYLTVDHIVAVCEPGYEREHEALMKRMGFAKKDP